MDFCGRCERWYSGTDGAHWRYAHQGKEEESEREGW